MFADSPTRSRRAAAADSAATRRRDGRGPVLILDLPGTLLPDEGRRPGRVASVGRPGGHFENGLGRFDTLFRDLQVGQRLAFIFR